jgi:hypothetical protein
MIINYSFLYPLKLIISWRNIMFFFRPLGGMYREYHGIKMIAEPKDMSLYRNLLPKQFSIPKQPAVFIFVADYLKVATWPFKVLPWRTSRYQEAGVFIRSSYQKVEGWFCLAMPISTWLTMALGRYTMGFPKYVVDKISLENKDGNWNGFVKHKDQITLSLDFTSDINHSLSPWEEKILNNSAFFEDITYLMFPAEKGPGINKIWIEDVVLPKWSPELGIIKVNINSDASWAGLIEKDITYPGVHNYFTGGNNLISIKLTTKNI